MLSLPMFAFMPGSVRRGFVGLGRRSRPTRASWMGSSIHPYTMLALNLLTQLVCVSGVNQLSSVSKPLFSTNF
jgi:UDP-xylose/UDP-N-acetylglucosamine transporter B4